ncbi:MBL fold metallo-hydrolase [Paenibacillus mendelii]|uniref:MBL fold metallo-hydrolase n=1 Tax=Paenibacillus mendelii TaxID=206163 RepID=A0ABV6JIX9_9BACL|nr:MBL fold metallo-hydrolase [Paenibacillus mendelii]MCQ6558796.1 MBL fold metallo-hydrolase [Paenibacillus mendelii]
MRITVLGPWGAYPKAGDATAGYLVEYDNRSMLVDCGSGVLAQLQNYKPLHDLNSVLISHRHYDHIADLGCFQYACLIDTDLERRSEPVPIYIAEDPDRELPYKSMKGSSIERIFAEERLAEGELEVSFFRTFHEAYCVGMSFEYKGKKLVYTADTCYHESLIRHCADADVLIAETSFYADMKDASKYGHMNAAEVGLLAKEAGVGKVVLTHLPHFGDVAQLASEVAEVYDGEIITAYSGLVITL